MAIDAALADVVASTTEPALGAIRLAWWREALERLDHLPPPAEPRLQGAASELLTRGLTGKSLAQMEDGYAAMLDDPVDGQRVAIGGRALFRSGARLLGVDDALLDEAGSCWAMAIATRRGLVAPAAETPDLTQLRSHRFPRSTRPLVALAVLAARDIERIPRVEAEATPGRALALLRHRFTGRLA